MSKIITLNVKRVAASALALAFLAPAAFAGNIGTSKSIITVYGQAKSATALCAAPKAWVKVCTQFGPAAPGQMFGPCQHYETQCQSPAYTGQ